MAAEPTATYASGKHGFELDHPGWDVAEEVFGCDVVLAEPDPASRKVSVASVSVSVQALAFEASLDEVARGQLASMFRVLTDLEIAALEPTKLCDIDAYGVRANYRQGIYAYTVDQRWLLADGKAYVVGATCRDVDYGRLESVFTAILESFRLRG